MVEGMEVLKRFTSGSGIHRGLRNCRGRPQKLRARTAAARRRAAAACGFRPGMVLLMPGEEGFIQVNGGAAHR